MNHSLLLLALLLSLITGFGQSDKYQKAMQDKLAVLDTTRNPEELKGLSAAFERIAEAEKTQWLPYYYAGLAQVNAGYFLTGGNMAGGLADKLDPMADKAEAMAAKAEALSHDNSEIFVLKKMIASLRMMADPMNRYMEFGPQAYKALETARKLNPSNPRVYLLEGQDKFFTPEQYGGSKTEAKRLFEEALKKFDAFSPASPMDPNWGRKTAEYFLMQAGK